MHPSVAVLVGILGVLLGLSVPRILTAVCPPCESCIPCTNEPCPRCDACLVCEKCSACQKPASTLYTGPDTGSKIQVLWYVEAHWDLATITQADQDGTFHFQYDRSKFKHSGKLKPGRWKLFSEHQAPDDTPPNDTKGETLGGQAAVGRKVYILWDEYTKWHTGTVESCKVAGGKIGKCVVHFNDSMGTHEYDLSEGSKTKWREVFKLDPVKWSFPRDAGFGNATNFMEIDIDVGVISRIRSWYEEHIKPHLSEETFASASDPSFNFYSMFAGGKFGSDIKWLSATNNVTFSHMSSFFDDLKVRPHVNDYIDGDGGAQLYIPTFIVRSRVKKSYHHLDWPVEVGSNGLTLMTPLYDMSDQTEGCNLLYKDARDREQVYQYKLGKAVIFGGGSMHSTQPCSPRSLEDVQRPWAFICFNFGTTVMEYWPELQKNIACSGKMIMRPDGTMSDPFLCDSYNAALKKYKQEMEQEDVNIKQLLGNKTVNKTEQEGSNAKLEGVIA